MLDEIVKVAERRRATAVSMARLRIGRLSGVAPEALVFAWEVARTETVAAQADLRIEIVPVVVRCKNCGLESEPRVGDGLSCRICGGAAGTVVRGRELELVAVEIVK